MFPVPMLINTENEGSLFPDYSVDATKLQPPCDSEAIQDAIVKNGNVGINRVPLRYCSDGTSSWRC